MDINTREIWKFSPISPFTFFLLIHISLGFGARIAVFRGSDDKDDILKNQIRFGIFGQFQLETVHAFLHDVRDGM